MVEDELGPGAIESTCFALAWQKFVTAINPARIRGSFNNIWKSSCAELTKLIINQKTKSSAAIPRSSTPLSC